ncbi:MAG: hypothetical protein KJ879_00025 [Nanoarchaeota archaeon]|nr:hypothetical protein [Nanoarchaeota archaeon]
MASGTGNARAEGRNRLSRGSLLFGSSMLALLLWIPGVVAYDSWSPDKKRVGERFNNLTSQRSELTQRIDEWERYVPMMSGSFAETYRDSLDKAKVDTSEMNQDISRLTGRFYELHKKGIYSWAAFVMN